MVEQLIVRAEDWPWGLRCMDCHQELSEGDIYSERLSGIADGDVDHPLFIAQIVCVSCGLGLRATDDPA